MKIARALAIAATLVSAGDRSQGVTFDISFTASGFVGWTGAGPTGELPPDDEVSGSFRIDTEQGVRDVPDFVSIGTNEDVEHQILNMYLAPTTGEIEIAGHGYALEELSAYVDVVDATATSLIHVGGNLLSEPMPGCATPGFVEQGISCPPVRYVTYGTNDFLLTVQLPSDAFGSAPPGFGYVTEGTLGIFGPESLRVKVSIDGGEPLELVDLPPDPVDGAVVCAAAHPQGDRPEVLAGGAKPGDSLCEPSGTAEERTAAAPVSRRDARIARTPAADAGLGRALRVSTALGTHRVDAVRVDRLLLAASKGASAAIEAPSGSSTEALRCARLKATPGSRRFAGMRGVPVADASGGIAHYDVRRPTRLCVAPGAAEGGERLLCYAARRAAHEPKARASRVWVAHALGVERLAVGRAQELCLPALDVE